MTQTGPDTDLLLQQAASGDAPAVEQLLGRHRARLKRMVRVHLDDRLAARVDPSDVVQDTLAEAAQGLSEYARQRPIPFYPWLRQIAWQRIQKTHDHHLAKKRSVAAEHRWDTALSSSSAMELANRFTRDQSSPSQQLARSERRQHVLQLLEQLSQLDREVLVLRYLEQLTPRECADVLQVTYDTFMKRHMRAVARLRDLLESGHRSPSDAPNARDLGSDSL